MLKCKNANYARTLITAFLYLYDRLVYLYVVSLANTIT